MSRRLGGTDAQLDAVRDGEYAVFDDAWRVALQYADAVTPAGSVVSDALFAELARHWEPAQIVEITSVICMFAFFNRFALALAIPVTT